MKRIWIKISVESLIAKIAYYEANGYDFEAKTLHGLISMDKQEKEIYERFLNSSKAAKIRRDAGFPDTK